MKIAVPVEDKNLEVAVRMGHAPYFAVYEISGEEFHLLELAVNTHAIEHHHEEEHHGRGHYHQGGHHHESGHHHGEGHEHHHGHDEHEVEHHRQHLSVLKGVDGVLVRGIGPNMKEALFRENISIYRLKRAHGETSDQLVKYFIRKRDSLEPIKD